MRSGIRGSLSALGALVFLAGGVFAGEQHSQDGGSPAVTPKGSATEISANVLPRKENNRREAKPFLLPGLDGAKHSLKDWKGKVIVLNFWASWCSPCLYEIPELVRYQDRYKARGLQIVGLGLDEERKLRNVQRTLEINYPVLVADPVKDGGLMAEWGNDTGVVPYTVVIDRSGEVVYVHHGVVNSDVFDEYVLPLLDKG